MTESPRVETLLVPTDGSRWATAAARRGFDIATQLGADVHVLSVADSSLATGAGYGGDSASIRASLREQADRRVASLREEATARGLDATGAVREGIPAAEIVDYADGRVDAIAMGTSGRGGVARAIVGSVADKVIRTATVPVLTVNRAALDESDTVETLLIPVDGSAPSEAAAARGVALAEQFGATVRFLSVADRGVADGVDAVSADELAERAGDRVDEVATATANGRVEWTSATVVGDPGEAIVDHAEDHAVDMVVMGTHGHGGFRRAVLGSVTDEVVRTATVPVLSVRDTGER